MVQFCTAYAGILSHHHIYATNTTGHMVADATGPERPLLPVLRPRRQPADRRPDRLQRVRPGALLQRPHQRELWPGDVSYISRLCDQNNIPFASNHRHGGDAGAGSGPGRSGLALHRQSLQPSHRLTFFPKAHTITLLIHLHRADAAAVLQFAGPTERGAPLRAARPAWRKDSGGAGAETPTAPSPYHRRLKGGSIGTLNLGGTTKRKLALVPKPRDGSVLSFCARGASRAPTAFHEKGVIDDGKNDPPDPVRLYGTAARAHSSRWSGSWRSSAAPIPSMALPRWTPR